MCNRKCYYMCNKKCIKQRTYDDLSGGNGKTRLTEYSYAMKSLFREIGNQMSGTGNHHLLSASLLAHVFV